MSPVSPAAPAASERRLAGIVHMIGGALALSGIDIVSKYVVAELAPVQMLALRAGFVMLILVPIFHRAGGLTSFRTRRLGTHLLRIACMFASILAFFQALAELPLAMVVALGFMAPIFVTALSTPMLGETVGPVRWAAVLLGFAGTVVVIGPSTARLATAAILPVIAALGWAVSQVLARKLTRTESDTTILLYLNTGLMLGLGVLAPFHWQTPGAGALGLCLLLAVLLVAAQWLMLRAVRLAPITVVTPFQYLEMLLAALFGWLLWREWPGIHVAIGGAMIVASGLMVVWLERGDRRAAAWGAE